MRDHDDARPPGALKQLDPAAISTELPVVVFADDADALASAEIPRVRLLPGRLHERWVLYPVYALDLVAGVLAVHFAVGAPEWSAAVVGLAWFLLYVWHWFYAIAYRYRRRLLKYTSVAMIFALTAALAYFSIERARPQLAMVGADAVAERAAAPGLYWAAVLTMLTAALLLAHLVFLGRGYRHKRPA